MIHNFGEDLLFWHKNRTKLPDPTLLFLYRTAALFTGSQNFRNQKKIHIVHENVDFNVSVMIWNASSKKIAVFLPKIKLLYLHYVLLLKLH